MADGGCPLWSTTNVDQHGAVCLNPELLNQIVQKSADVIKVMEVWSLWPHLLNYGVINEEKQEELKVVTLLLWKRQKQCFILYHGAFLMKFDPVNVRNIDSFDSFKVIQKKTIKEKYFF